MSTHFKEKKKIVFGSTSTVMRDKNMINHYCVPSVLLTVSTGENRPWNTALTEGKKIKDSCRHAASSALRFSKGQTSNERMRLETRTCG